LFLNYSCVYSQTITSASTSQNKYQINSRVDLKVFFNDSQGNGFCGLTIDWGNGDKEDVRIGDSDKKFSPFTIYHVYKVAGEFTIRLEGKFQLRGLSSVLACNGKTDVETILLYDKKVLELEKQKIDAINQAKKAAETLNQIEKNITLKELQLKQKELELKEEELRLKKEEMERNNTNKTTTNNNPSTKKIESSQTKVTNTDFSKSSEIQKCKRLGLKEDSPDFKICIEGK